MCLILSVRETRKRKAIWRSRGTKTVTVYKQVNVNAMDCLITPIYRYKFKYNVNTPIVAQGRLSKAVVNCLKLRKLNGFEPSPALTAGAIHVYLKKPDSHQPCIKCTARTADFVGMEGAYAADSEGHAAFKRILITSDDIRKMYYPGGDKSTPKSVADAYDKRSQVGKKAKPRATASTRRTRTRRTGQ